MLFNCGAIPYLPCRNIWSPVEVLDEHLSLLVEVMYQPRSSVGITKINLGLMINVCVFLSSNTRVMFSGPVIALGLTWKKLSAAK